MCFEKESPHLQDKSFRGKFPVSFIAFVEDVPPNTFSGISHAFQVYSLIHIPPSKLASY